MYAVIRAGGRQYKVAPGDRITVDLLRRDNGDEVSYTPLLVVSDSGEVISGSACESWPVTAVVIGKTKDRKLHGFKYKPKVGYRRRWGHRQQYSVLEIRSVGDVIYDPDESSEAEAGSEAEESSGG
jgi:large subunit ribosomal protein L21